MSFLFWTSRGSFLGFVSETILLISNYICLPIWSKCCQPPARFSSAPSISAYIVSTSDCQHRWFLAWGRSLSPGACSASVHGQAKSSRIFMLPPQEQPSVDDLQKGREKPLAPLPFEWDDPNAWPRPSLRIPQHGRGPVAQAVDCSLMDAAAAFSSLLLYHSFLGLSPK